MNLLPGIEAPALLIAVTSTRYVLGASSPVIVVLVIIVVRVKTWGW